MVELSLSAAEVCERYKIGRRLLRKLVRSGQFPKPAISSGRIQRWTHVQLEQFERTKAGKTK